MTGNELADAALTLIGAPFRLHGRDPATGLDCIGVFSAALAICGVRVRLPNTYRLRGATLPDLARFAQHLDFERTTAAVQRGDVLFARPGPVQFHLMIATGGERYVHAHAGLRRVVLSPRPADWLVEQVWRSSNF